MRLDKGTVYLKNVRLHAFHGVNQQEQVVGNDFIVNLRASYPLGKAMQSDDVDHALNYTELLEVVKTEMGQPSKLLENVALRIAEKVFQRFPEVGELCLDLRKVNPPMGADCDGAGIELHLINDKTT
ncbi:MAG: dihydroneopterin aldolase [Prevotella sp.]|nr:dihydroneopterin aldolase [Prevotella sp.]